MNRMSNVRVYDTFRSSFVRLYAARLIAIRSVESNSLDAAKAD